jgi:hypothetical protein
MADGILRTDGFAEPPVAHNEEGEPRRAGFELEFGGLQPERAAEDVAAVLGGRVRRESAFEFIVEETPWGEATVEVDWALLRERSYLKVLKDLGIEFDPEDTDRVEQFLQRVATTVVPLEVVTPPLPLTELPVLDDLRQRLHGHGGEGTEASLLYAFGLHINPEAPALGVDSILAHLRAFLLLHDWIRGVAPVDLSRRIAPYIEPFPKDYAHRVLDGGYAPDLEDFVADYTRANPSRNRALDLLPLLAHVEGGSYADVSPRPAYHYRLPNCRLSDADWRLAHEWNGWVYVERQAAQPERLAEATQLYLAQRPDDLRAVVDGWVRDAG